MQRHVFRWEIIVVLIIGIKIFHLFIIDGYFQCAFRIYTAEIAAVGIGRYGLGQRSIQAEGKNQFSAALAVYILVGISLNFFGLDRFVK